MKNLKSLLCIFVALALLAVSGCGTSPDEGEGETATSTTTTTTTTTTTESSAATTTTTASETASDETTTTSATTTESDNTPISTTTTAVEVAGDNIAFTKTAHFSLVYYDEQARFENEPSDFVGRLVRNKNEYDALDWQSMLAAHSIDASGYTESYFTDKALIAIYMRAHSCSYEMLIDAVKTDGATLTVCYTENQTTLFADMPGQWCMLIEVDASAVKDVTAVVGDRKTEIIT